MNNQTKLSQLVFSQSPLQYMRKDDICLVPFVVKYPVLSVLYLTTEHLAALTITATPTKYKETRSIFPVRVSSIMAPF